MKNLIVIEKNQTIEIKRLDSKDGQIVYSLIEESREDLKNLVWSQSATLESTEKFLMDKNNSQDQVYGVFLDNTLVGVLELRKKEEFSELGYWLGSHYRGNGIMKLAVKALVDEKIKETPIIAHIREKNHPSHKILEFAGLDYDHCEIWENEEWLHLKRSQ